MECVELAPAFEPRHTSDSGSKLHALHTLRETRPPLSSVCAICSVSPENLRKKTRFSPILSSAAQPQPNRAKRLECVELAPAFVPRRTSDSESRLNALHTLCAPRPHLASVIS